MFTQRTWRSHLESRLPTDDNFCRQRVLLAAVFLLLIVAPVVESQEQPAKQRPKPGRVKLIDTVTGSKNSIGSLAFTNGGKALVSIGYNDELEIKSWDVATRKVTATISENVGSTDWTLSPDGNTVAVGISASKPSKIRLYDLRQKMKPQDIPLDNFGTFYAVAFNSDGKVLAWVWAPERTLIRLWNVPAGKLIGTLPAKDSVGCLAFRPGGKSLASSGPTSAVSLWDVGTGNETKTFEVGKGMQFRCMAFSPDGKTLAVGAQVQGKADGEIKLWEVATGKNTRTLPGVIAPFAFNKDGTMLSAGTRDGKVKLWNVTTGKDLITLALHTAATCATFSPDGRTLVTGGADKAIMWWELPVNAHTYPRLELQMGIPDESRPR